MTDKRPLTAYAKGVMGETAACRYLNDRGAQLLQRRYRAPCGEVDLIVLDDEILVFVEVKTRERAPSAAAQHAVSPAKQRRLIDAARYYLVQHPEHAKRMIRFDVITLTKEGVLHIPNAFEGNEW